MGEDKTAQGGQEDGVRPGGGNTRPGEEARTPAAEGETTPQGKEAREPAPSPAPHQPSTGALSSSETPKDMAPMKSFREVRSQSHTSTLSRRSTSPGFRLLRGERGAVRGQLVAPRPPHPRCCRSR